MRENGSYCFAGDPYEAITMPASLYRRGRPMKFDDVLAFLHDQIGVVPCVTPNSSDDTPGVFLIPPNMRPLPLEHIPVVIRVAQIPKVKHITILVRPSLSMQLDVNKLGRLTTEAYIALIELAEREVAHHIHVRREVAFHLGITLS